MSFYLYLRSAMVRFPLLCYTTLQNIQKQSISLYCKLLTFSEELSPVAPGSLSAQWLLNQQWNLAWIASLMNPIALHLVVYFTPHKSRDSLLLLHLNIWGEKKLAQKNSCRGKRRCRSKIKGVQGQGLENPHILTFLIIDLWIRVHICTFMIWNSVVDHKMQLS